MGDRQKDKGMSNRFSGHGDLVARRFYLIVSLFVAIVFCLLALSRFQTHVLDSVRAYVAAENFWSKGQKNAVYHLVRYAASGNEAEYKKFLAGIAVSLGDRQARLALQGEPSDIDKARQGFLQGGNYPEDVEKMITFFLDYSDVSYMKKAIGIWTDADGYIDQLLRLGQSLHAELHSERPSPARVHEILDRVDKANRQVTALENQFSSTLESAARAVTRMTNLAVIVAALLLLMVGIILSRLIVRGIRRTEVALVDSEARFRHVVESNIVGITFWEADGAITDANDAFLSMIGYTRDELLGGGINWQQLTPAGFREQDEKALREIRQQGRCAPYEKEMLHKDGHPVAVYLAAARFDDSGESGVCFVLDVSERKRAEQVEKVAASVFQAAKEAIIVTDRTPCIQAVNPAFTRITGYEPEDVLGKNPNILSSGRHEADFFRAMWEQLQKDGGWQGDIWNRRRSGEVYQEWLSISVIHDDKGEISQFVGVFSDITEQRRLEERLKQSQKMEAIGTLVGGIAHDFNNTLAAMQGNLYLAQRHNRNNPAVAEKLENIEKLGVHSAEMVKQLLTFARKGVVQMAPLMLNTLLQGMSRLTATIIPENIRFDMELCDEELTVSGDATQLQQLFLNLLNNARDAVAGTAEPAITCRLEPFETDVAFRRAHPGLQGSHMAHVVVTDNGCGIPEHQLDHIFDPFFTTKEVGQGTGLGMSMVYGSVQTHGGVIAVESTVGKGTSVNLYLPLITGDEAVQTDAVEAGVAQTAPERKVTVLLVDDNASVRDVCAEVLNSLGYKTLMADDGISALACFEEHRERIGLVVTDVVMPGMGGFKAAQRMRKLSSGIPLIFITGYDREQTNIPASLMKNSLILTKPFMIDAFSRAVHRILGSGKDD